MDKTACGWDAFTPALTTAHAVGMDAAIRPVIWTTLCAASSPVKTIYIAAVATQRRSACLLTLVLPTAPPADWYNATTGESSWTERR
eukprot:SAG31_NODE_21307_length_552_cov_16.545254_1_plen_86_part_10